MPRKDEESWPEHPLFPAEEGEEPHRIEFIQVVRYEHGRALLVPTTFRSGELTSLDQIYQTYGGGLYELIGRRCSVHDPTAMGRISAKVRCEIAGPSRPLVIDPNAPPEAPKPPPIVQQLSPPPSAGMSDQVLIAIMNSQAQAQQANAQMMMQMFQQARADQAAMMTTVMQLGAQQQQTTMGMVSAMMAHRGGGTDEISKIATLFKDLGVLAPKGEGAGDDTESIGGIISNVADIVAGAVELKGAGGVLPNGPPAPPGSAAAVLGAGAKQDQMFEANKKG
jgi:hypothetical protein